MTTSKVLPAAIVALSLSLARSEPRQSCESLRKEARFNVYFERVELAKLVQTVSDATCRSFIVGDAVRGTISLIGPENAKSKLDAEQFYSAFLAALDANGLAVYREGRFHRVVEKAKARQHPLPLLEPGAPFPASAEVVTRLMLVKHAELEPLRTVLGQFVMPGGDIVAAPPDLLIVTDVAANLQRLETLVAKLDVPKHFEAMRLLPVRHAEASTLAEKVQRALAPKAGRPTDSLTIVTDERTNRLLVIGAPELTERAAKLIEELDVEVPDDKRARVFRLKNADAKDVAGALEGVAQALRAGRPPAPGQASSEVRITPNEAQNALVIVAGAADYRTLVEVIEQLDLPLRQVFIETVIMEVNVVRDSKLGVSFHGAAGTAEHPVVFGSQPKGAPSSLTLKSLGAVSGLVAGAQGPILTQVSKVLGFELPSFGVVLQAMQLSSDVNVLSTPHILTTDNKEAEISVGQRIPFQSGVNPQVVQQLVASGNAAASSAAASVGNVTRERVELKLTVKPDIGDGDDVRLEVNQQAEEIAGSNALGPITSTRAQRTAVVARNGETLVLGGIMVDRLIDESNKTPVLGDLPLIGRLFRSQTTGKSKVNLLVFLTPHIIRGPADFKRLAEAKLAERQQLLELFYGEVPGSVQAVDFSRKRGPLAAMGKTLEREAARPENGGSGGPGEQVIVPR